jgi:hypothetical protein
MGEELRATSEPGLFLVCHCYSSSTRGTKKNPPGNQAVIESSMARPRKSRFSLRIERNYMIKNPTGPKICLFDCLHLLTAPPPPSPTHIHEAVRPESLRLSAEVRTDESPRSISSFRRAASFWTALTLFLLEAPCGQFKRCLHQIKSMSSSSSRSLPRTSSLL